MLGDDGDAAATEGPASAPSPAAIPPVSANATGDGGEPAAGAASGGPGAFVRWSPVHAFIDDPVVRGAAVGDAEAIVASRGNHVAITRDAGASWTWSRHTHAFVLDVDGFAGGPYVVVGTAGYVALSSDGVTWSELPRYTAQDLVAVVASKLGIVAADARGGYVRYARDGSSPQAGWLPGGFRTQGLALVNDTLVASAGRKALGSADGVTWTEFAESPLGAAGRFGTRAGSCTLAKTGKRRSVVCAVRGIAHGIAPGVVAVDDHGTVALTLDGGTSWRVADLPFAGANAIFGAPAGPFYALGAKGAVASSKDGRSWTDLAWEDPVAFRDGIIDGSTIVIVGDSATIVYSTNGGQGWQYAEAPISGNFLGITKSDEEFVISDGRTALTSPDGATWTEDGERAFVVPSGAEDCATGLPEPDARCRFAQQVTSPAELPDLRGLDFRGDAGLAYGDQALVGFSADGGATWTTRQGLGLAGVRLLENSGARVLASDGAKLALSSDGGASFTVRSVEGRGPRVTALLLAADGTAYAAGRKNLLWRAAAGGDAWTPATLAEGTKVDLAALFAVDGRVFAAGERGELLRSEDGLSFVPAITGRKERIQAMTGEGMTVLAVTTAGRSSGNVLLRSDDGGAHFVTLHEISDWSEIHAFSWQNDQLHYQDRVSDDLGATWRSDSDWAWAAAEEIGDGSRARLFVRPLPYVKDRLFFMADKDEKSWTIIDAPYSEGGRFACAAANGCWMSAGGDVFRPQ